MATILTRELAEKSDAVNGGAAEYTRTRQDMLAADKAAERASKRFAKAQAEFDRAVAEAKSIRAAHFATAARYKAAMDDYFSIVRD